jgi:proteasome lid subunit RPN8/RPN11
LQVPRRFIEEMVAHARTELPNECVGLLAGRFVVEATPGEQRIGRVERRYALVNAAASPKLFLSDDRSMFAAHKDMHREGLEVLAVYHSHPTSKPEPSRTDLEQNYWPGIVSFIISLQEAEPRICGWWLGDRDYQPAEWELID